MFKEATKIALRFDTSYGRITTEDLWNLPLTSKNNVSLDSVAIDIHNKLQNLQTTSFVSDAPIGDRELELSMEIVKEIIKDRQEENAKNLEAKSNASQRQRILEVLKTKEDESLLNKSEEELRAMLK